MTIILLLNLLAQTGWERVTALRPGQEVIVSYRGGMAEGSLVTATADQVVVRVGGGKEVTAARVDVKRLWVPGHKRARNAAIGGAIGVLATVGPAVFLRTRLNNETGGGEAAAAGLIAGGAGLGTTIGALNRGRDLVYKP